MPWLCVDPRGAAVMAEANCTFVSTDFYLGQYLSFPVPDFGPESTVQSHLAEFGGVAGTLQRLISDPDAYADEFEDSQDVSNILGLLSYRTWSRDVNESCDVAGL